MKYLPDIIAILFYVVLIALVFGVAIGLTWLIATSDMPLWLKFLLLK